jgi:hypothetical protein
MWHSRLGCVFDIPRVRGGGASYNLILCCRIQHWSITHPQARLQ